MKAGEVLVREVAHPGSARRPGRRPARSWPSCWCWAPGRAGRLPPAGRRRWPRRPGGPACFAALPVIATMAAHERPKRSQQADDFLALAAVRQDQGDVVGMDHAEIAVHGPGGVEDVGARAGRIEGAGDLLADVGRFAGAGDADAAGQPLQQIDGLQRRNRPAARRPLQGRRPRRERPRGHGRDAHRPGESD